MNRLINRRLFFRIAGAGVGGYFMSPVDLGAQSGAAIKPGARILNTARNVIYILLPGAPSQVDTFDLRVGPWTPADFSPATVNGIDFPQGLMPGIASQLHRISIVRSCQATALVHALLQTWNQIARNPASATGKIAPNVGSIVAVEMEKTKTTGQNLPGFVSLNTGGSIVRSGYLPDRYSPFDVTAAAGGLVNLINADGEITFKDRYMVFQALNRVTADRAEYNEMRDFYASARGMMYDPAVAANFRFSNDEQLRYGNSAFGNSCIVARNLVNSNLGTRYIQIDLGGWDNHTNIYQANNGVYRPARQLDSGLTNLIVDLAGMPGSIGRTRLDETLIVVKGEFGRTVGAPTSALGRDHYFVHSALFAGGGVQGGRVIGRTTADGRFVEDPGWSQERPVASEDIAATVYSALGIDYTTTRHDDPLGRGFEYIPSTGDWPAYPITELF